MQVRVAPAREGWLWVKQGWRLFRLQPLALATILTTYFFAMLIAGALVSFLDMAASGGAMGYLGKGLSGLVRVLFAATVPGATAGFMLACKRALEKKPVQVKLLFEPFREARARRNLLILGFIQVVALSLVVALAPSFTPDVKPELRSGGASNSSPAPEPAAAENSDSEASTSQTESGSASAPTRPSVDTRAPGSGSRAFPKQASPRGPPNSEELIAKRKSELLTTFVQLLLYLPITIALWYSPILVYWHGIGPGKAIFFSAAAIWRNRRAFAVYSLALFLCLFVAAYSIVALLPMFNRLLGGKFMLFVFIPVVLVLFTWVYCTVYVTYAEIFVRKTDEAETGAEPT